MNKRIINYLLMVAILLTMLPVTAWAVTHDAFTAQITVGGSQVDCTFKVLTEPDGATPGTVQIGNGTVPAIATTSAGAITIPSSVSDDGKDYNITVIGQDAFSRCYTLTSLSFASNNNLTIIGDNAFFACSGLTGALTLPDGVTTIGESAFSLCSGLDGTLTLPASVTTIGRFAFDNCSKLTGDLILPDSVTTIGECAFAFCRDLNGTLTLPENLTSIEYAAFAGCSGLTGPLTLPDGVTTIGGLAFQNCSGFTGNLSLPSGVTTIGNYAFSDCSGFTGSLTLPAGITTIDNGAFTGCGGFTGLIFETGSQLTTINDSAFYRCNGLTGNITIPAGVTTIGDFVFADCSGLTSVTFSSSTAPSINNTSFGYFRDNYIIYIPHNGTGYDTGNWAFYSSRIKVNAAAPVITHDLSNTQVEYNQNAVPTALDATATVTDGGTISYQWYSNTTNSTVGAISLMDATTATYTPSTATVGITYYYCVVTNTNNAVNGNTTAQTISAIANIKVNAAGGGSRGGGSSSNSTVSNKPAITVAEVNSEHFSDSKDVHVEADVSSAFGQSVIVKITDDTNSQNEIFSLAVANDKVYPFDISLYSKDSNEKIQPKDGYSVRITLPVPKELLDDREKIKVVYGRNGSLETLKSELTEKNGNWYITFEALHFSPYALIVSAETPALPEIAPWVNPFSDVGENDWFYSAVQYAAQNGLMKGNVGNTFSPELVTNRGMIATILYNLHGSGETEQSTFNDVKPGTYYANAVAWAQKKGIIAGYGNGRFGPDDSITRQQLAVMLWKYAGSPVVADSKGLASFKDTGKISAYAQGALAWANQAGIINGKDGGFLDPKGNATRAETAQVLLNFIQKSDLMK